MIAEQRLNFPVCLFIYLHLLLPRFAFSQKYLTLYDGPLNSTAGLSTLWINRLIDFSSETVTPILQVENDATKFLCDFYCKGHATDCFLGVLLSHNSSASQEGWIISARLVWSANRNHPMKTNATLQLGQDGNLVLADSDGSLVWSTNTAGKSVSGLNLTEMGNLVLYDMRKRAIWQSFDQPTDSLLPGQTLVSGQNLTASVSAENLSQGLYALTILNRNWVTYINSDPPQFYSASSYPDRTYFSFDGQILTALKNTNTSPAHFIKLGPDGHFRVYQWDNKSLEWTEVSDILTGFWGDCGYPMICGRYSICSNDGNCTCPLEEGNFFRPSINGKPYLGCTEMTSISCDSPQYHSLIELRRTQYFALYTNFQPNSSIFWPGKKMLEDCKQACLSNCSCKAAVFEYDPDGNESWKNGSRRGSCLLLNEVFSLINGRERIDSTVFLKVQNSPKQKPKSLKVIIGSIFAALFGIIFILLACSVLYKRRIGSSKDLDYLDLARILPGILTPFSYNELKITTEDFSRKLGEGGFGSVYEGTLSDGTKIAVKRLNGLGEVKESFLTEVKTVGSIHHVNLVKLIGF